MLLPESTKLVDPPQERLKKPGLVQARYELVSISQEGTVRDGVGAHRGDQQRPTRQRQRGHGRGAKQVKGNSESLSSLTTLSKSAVDSRQAWTYE